MAMECQTTCAVLDCGQPMSEPTSLCDKHRLPGVVVEAGESTTVVTIWYAEHDGESGLILLNDWALVHFGGSERFISRLRRQAFINVRLVLRPDDAEATNITRGNLKPGMWSGPWSTKYPWEDGFTGEELRPSVMQPQASRTSCD